MTVEFEALSLPVPSEVKIEFSLTTQVNVTDFTAQRKVSKLLLDQVGNFDRREKIKNAQKNVHQCTFFCA